MASWSNMEINLWRKAAKSEGISMLRGKLLQWSFPLFRSLGMTLANLRCLNRCGASCRALPIADAKQPKTTISRVMAFLDILLRRDEKAISTFEGVKLTGCWSLLKSPDRWSGCAPALQASESGCRRKVQPSVLSLSSVPCCWAEFGTRWRY